MNIRLALEKEDNNPSDVVVRVTTSAFIGSNGTVHRNRSMRILRRSSTNWEWVQDEWQELPDEIVFPADDGLYKLGFIPHWSRSINGDEYDYTEFTFNKIKNDLKP